MKTAKLSDICEFIARGISPKYTEDEKLGITILNQKCIRNKKVFYEYSRLHNLSIRSVNEAKFIKSGDILINSTGHGTLGRTALVEDMDKPLLVDSHITILRPFEGLFEPRYFAYLIGQSENDFIEMATGTSGQTELPRALLKEYVISYEPSLEEQRRIVSRLDATYEKIDRAIELTEANLQNTNYLFAAKAGEIFAKAPNKKALGEVVTLQRGYDLPKQLRKAGRYKLVSSSGIIDHHDEFKITGPGVYTGRSGSVGRTFYEEEDFWPLNTTLYVKDFHGNHPRYCYWLISNLNLMTFAGGTGVPTLNRNHVHVAEVHVHPPEEQVEIANQLDTLESQTGKLKDSYKKRLDHLKALRQSLLHQTFSTTDKV